MKVGNISGRSLRHVLCGLGLLAMASSVGCTVDVGGQTLPSPYWQSDDVQYFPPGPEFKLSREAAAIAAFDRDARPPGAVIAPAGGALAPAPGVVVPVVPGAVVPLPAAGAPVPGVVVPRPAGAAVPPAGAAVPAAAVPADAVPNP